ncbi:MAG: hypothetical protein HOP28_13910 [Gemmatimonadales bacterium]|nr:hypothetical protein [Gemmatimonadales bacterium]
MTMSPFEHQPDETLGRLLREHLTGPAPEAFLREVRVAVAGAPRADQWDVLSGWARPRTMALAVAAGFLLWLGAWFADSTSPIDVDAGVSVASSLPAHTVMSAQPPAAAEIMAAMRGDRRSPRR